jgi:MFS family permease
MKEKIYVDRLFAAYDDTPELRDFKEEITVNLRERVKELTGKGMAGDEALEKACAELGDITAIADAVAKQKRTETIGQMYMKAKVPLTKRTAAGITAASGALLIAASIAFISIFGHAGAAPYYLAAALLAVACGLYAYFGLTQETAAHYAMKRGRALAYGAVCLAGFLGAGLSVVSFVFDGWAMSAAIGVKAVLLLPAVCGFIFLLATETKRQKPWLKAMMHHETGASMVFHYELVDPVKAARFGVMSGGLWLLAIALFITLGIFAGWSVSWLPPLFALPIQVFMVAYIFKRKGEG